MLRIHFPTTLASCGFPTPHFSGYRLPMFRHEGRTPVIQTFVCAPFPVRVWPCMALAAHRYYDGSDSCLPSPRLTGLPVYLATHS